MNIQVEYYGRRELIDPTLIFVCGASAVGKTTLAKYSVKYLQTIGIGAKMPVGYTTRNKRDDENEGVDYHFISHEDFESVYLPQIKANPYDWDVDEIRNNYYFNRYSLTAPDSEDLVSILPISFNVCREMVYKYRERYPKIALGILAVLLSNSNVNEWETRMAKIRPNRDISTELTQNNSFTPLEYIPSTSIVPTWRFEVDAIQFIRKLPLVIRKLPLEDEV